MSDLGNVMPGVARIRERFLAMHEDRHDRLEDFLTRIESGGASGGDCQDALCGARDLLHKIAGSAGSLGFGELGEAAIRAEAVLQDHIDTNFRDQSPATRELERFLEISITYCS